MHIKLAKYSWRHEQWHKNLRHFNQIKTDWIFRNKYLVLKKCGLTNEFRYIHYNRHKVMFFYSLWRLYIRYV
ncbi:hypothetical protein ABID42_002663 [Arcicella rosea]